MRFEIERLRSGWADVRFHLDNSVDNLCWTCYVREVGTTYSFNVENKSWHFDVEFWDSYGSPRFFFEFLKLLNEISSIESGRRYVLLKNDSSGGAFSVDKSNPDWYEISLCDYSPDYNHGHEPGVIFDIRGLEADTKVFVIPEYMRLDYMAHVELCRSKGFAGNRASRYIRANTPSFGEKLPDKALIVDERGQVLGRRGGIIDTCDDYGADIQKFGDCRLYYSPVKKTLREAEFLRFMLSVEAALGKYATPGGLEYFMGNWTSGSEYGDFSERIFPCEEFAKLKKFLRSKGIPEPTIPDFVEEKKPELITAIENGEPVEVLRGLIEAGADVNAKDNNQGTALMEGAFWSANPEVLRVLIEAGADVDAKDRHDWTALMWAAFWNDNPEILRVLIEAGADVNAEEMCGITILAEAARSNSNPEILRVLTEAGANVDTEYLFEFAACNKNPENPRALIDVGTGFNTKDDNGWTALVTAAKNKRDYDVLRFIKIGLGKY